MINFAFGLGLGYVLGIYIQYYVTKMSKDNKNDGE
jgi:hypothetical protein